MRLILPIWGICLFIVVLSSQAQVTPDTRLLSLVVLQSADRQSGPLAMTEFTAMDKSHKASAQLQGSITLRPLKNASQLEIISDLEVSNLALTPAQLLHNQKRAILPVMTFDFVINGDDVIPTVRTFQDSTHFYWDYIIGPGKIWQESSDGDFNRISMPFSLTEKNQNCVHNGIISFLLSPQGTTSNFYYQVSSETCQYFKADFWGFGQAEFTQKLLKNADKIISGFKQEKIQRLPTQPINQLTGQYPGISLQALSLSTSLAPSDLTLMGIVKNGVHHVSECQTRAGLYPYCAELVLPSFSTAKSLLAGLAMLRLEKLYPGTFSQKVGHWVDECSGEQWKDVTFGQLLNMSTGNYLSAEYHSDERANHVFKFFLATQNKDKLAYSCETFTRQAKPGSKFIYHTSDTYLLGVALNRYLEAKLGKPADVFNDILLKDIWPAIKLSPLAYRTRRTLDKSQQAFSGYGLYFIRDDMAKINEFFNDPMSAELLDQNNLNSALQRGTRPAGLPVLGLTTRYKNGFWASSIGEFTGCDNPTWLPYMSGYGGISVVFIPSNRLYYYFSDSEVGQYDWRAAITELDKFNPICKSNSPINSNNNGS
jgi:hypothetical protein